MTNISNILEGKVTFRDNTILEKLTADDMTHIKIVSMTSVDLNEVSKDTKLHWPIIVEILYLKLLSFI